MRVPFIKTAQYTAPVQRFRSVFAIASPVKRVIDLGLDVFIPEIPGNKTVAQGSPARYTTCLCAILANWYCSKILFGYWPARHICHDEFVVKGFVIKIFFEQ